MAATLIPSTSVEFDVMTTEPAWGSVEDVDLDAHHDKDGKEYSEPKPFKYMGVFTRDLRLGNLSSKIDDIAYLEDSQRLAHALLARGYEDQAFLALARVGATLELSQSRGGFMRKNSRSLHQTGESVTRDEGSQGMFFGKKKRRNDNGGY